MDNLKYPKVSYLHNAAPIEVFDLLNQNHAWKMDGHIFKDADLKYISLTHDGSSTGVLMMIDEAVTCVTDCHFEVGFAVKRKYHTPGRGNQYPENHPYSRPYYVPLTEDTDVENGKITAAGIVKAEMALLDLITKDNASLKEADFFSAHKVAYLGAGADVLIDGASVTLAEGISNDILTIDTTAGWTLIGLTPGLYFTVEDAAAAVIDQGIGLFGVDAGIQFDIHSRKNYGATGMGFSVIEFPSAGTINANVYFKDNTALNAQGTIATFAAAIEAGGVDTVVDGKTIYITDDTTSLVDIAYLPCKADGSVSVMPVKSMLNGAARWPINLSGDLENRFLGRYNGMEGQRQELPFVNQRYSILQYVVDGVAPVLSGGASSSEGFSTRVDIVVSAAAVKENSELATIVGTASL